MIKYFSLIHKLHCLLRFEEALAFARIFHEIVNFSSFLLIPTSTCLAQCHYAFFRALMTFGYAIVF